MSLCKTVPELLGLPSIHSKEAGEIPLRFNLCADGGCLLRNGGRTHQAGLAADDVVDLGTLLTADVPVRDLVS